MGESSSVRVTDERLADAPKQQTLRRVLALLEPARKLINRKVYGIENLPERGALLVGNHTPTIPS